MKNPILLTIENPDINLDYTNLYLCIFINCKLTSDLTIKLNNLNAANEVQIFIANLNKYSKTKLKTEQVTIYQQIQNGMQPDLLFYSKLDPKLSEYDKYLDLKPELLIKKDIDKICQSLNDAYLTKTEHNFVIEFKLEGSKQMIDDVTKFHKYVNAMSVVFTNQKSKVFTCSNLLSDGDQIISKSSNDVKYSYFFIPRSKCYELPQKVLFINKQNVLEYTKHHIHKNYILACADDIQESNYLNKMISSYRIKKLEQIVTSPNLFYNQNIQPLAIIKLVEQYNNLEICTINSSQQLNSIELKKNSEQYNNFILSYKTDLYNNQNRTVLDIIK